MRACRHLADNSKGLQTAMDLVLSYEQRTHKALAHLLGRAWTAGDLLFHGACFLALLCTGPWPARLPILAAWLSNWLLERFILTTCSSLLSFNSHGQVVVEPHPTCPIFCLYAPLQSMLSPASGHMAELQQSPFISR